MASCALQCNSNGTDLDLLGLPQLPEIPKIILCLHFPGSEGWNKHWMEFNKKVKDFHQAMIDFNWKILEWYSLKSKQMQRFGMKSVYIAGTMMSGPRMTVIQTKTISEGDVTAEVKKCLPDPVKKDVIQLEKIGYRLCLQGKIFIFNRAKVIVIDYDKDADKSFYRNCLKFSLYEKNEKINIFEAYSRVYGGLKSSFIVGGIGGLLVGLVTGYYERHPIYTRQYAEVPEQSLLWLISKRWVVSSVLYTILERVLLIRFSQPQRHILAGTTGAMCGMLFGLFDNCSFLTMMYATGEFGIYAYLLSIILHKQKKPTCSNEDY